MCLVLWIPILDLLPAEHLVETHGVIVQHGWPKPQVVTSLQHRALVPDVLVVALSEESAPTGHFFPKHIAISGE